MTENTENRITFLTSAIIDAQELIRYTDTKTAIAITIVGSYIVAFFSVIDKIVEYYKEFTILFWIPFSLFLLAEILCIVIATRIIKPTINPADNIVLGNKLLPNIKFFLGKNIYDKKNSHFFKNSTKHKLDDTFESYTNDVNNSSIDDILSCLSFELLKVSYIRNVKNDRFNALLWFLLATTILFIFSYLIFKFEIPPQIARPPLAVLNL